MLNYTPLAGGKCRERVRDRERTAITKLNRVAVARVSYETITIACLLMSRTEHHPICRYSLYPFQFGIDDNNVPIYLYMFTVVFLHLFFSFSCFLLNLFYFFFRCLCFHRSFVSFCRWLIQLINRILILIFICSAAHVGHRLLDACVPMANESKFIC